MQDFLDFFGSALTELETKAQERAGEGRLETAPHIRMWIGQKQIFPPEHRIACLFKSGHVEIYNPENRAKNQSIKLEELISGENPPERIEVWWLGEKPRGGYFGETRAEYDGEQAGVGFIAAKMTISRNSASGWSITRPAI